MTGGPRRITDGVGRSGLLALLGVATLACGTGDLEPVDQPPGTVRMVERLDSIRAAADPREHGDLNSQRAQLLRERELPDDPRARMINQAMVAEELMNAGRAEEVIESLESIRDTIPTLDARVPRQFIIGVLDLLAIANLRAWLKANCVERPDPTACVLPLEPTSDPEAGEHARRAVEVYQGILQRTPTDRTVMWLYNLAGMAAGEHPEGVQSRWRIPPEALRGAGRLPRYPDVAADLGLDVVGHAGGTIVDDFDGDGDLDIVASASGPNDQLRYFRNEADGTFTERTRQARLEGLTRGLQLLHADYDNDGDLDLYVLRGAWGPGHPSSLLRNEGSGTFTDVTEEAELLAVLPSQAAGWADYDSDGDLDLFVGYESLSERGTHHPARLYRNEGDGTFTDVAAEVGVDVVGFTKGVAWGDVDNDGRPDLYVSNLGEENVLLHNEGPDGEGGWSFRDVTDEAGVSEPVESFPTWFFDYDNDGWLDLFVSGYSAQIPDVVGEYLGEGHGAAAPGLYRNLGDGTFRRVTGPAGLDRVLYSMGSNFGDLDNDGWQDFYVGTGDPDVRTLLPNRMFRSAADDTAAGRRFEEVTGSGGFGHLAKGHAVAFADIDGDGDQDVYQVLGGAYEGDVGRNALYENPGGGHRWITLRLEGRETNRSALGARVRVTVEEDGATREIHRRVTAGGSFGGNSLQLEIGLGEADAVPEIEVFWPASDQRTTYTNVEMDRVYRVVEGNPTLEPVDVRSFELSG